MLTAKDVANYRRRIKNARNSFSVMGDMMLHIEIDAMLLPNAIELRDALKNSRSPLTYPYLDKKCGF